MTPRNDTPLPKSVPVTILTGFLGAGKTSVLNHILHAEVPDLIEDER
jgi:tRNA A37 threonylcarbamoyladenosine biosynthesis protein TsaE